MHVSGRRKERRRSPAYAHGHVGAIRATLADEGPE